MGKLNLPSESDSLSSYEVPPALRRVQAHGRHGYVPRLYSGGTLIL